MAKTTYLGANVEVTTDSFGGWINKTNQVIYDMGTVVLTAGLVAQPNSTNGAEVTGNSHVEGIFSANTIVAVDSLRGGTVSTPANLVITTNTVFQQSNLVDIQANTNLFNVDANNVVISSNVTLDGGSTKDFTATLGDITTTSTLFDITATTFNLTGTSTIDGPILNVDTTDLDVTANTLFTAATLSANVTTVDIDYITFNLDGTTFNHTSQDITVDTNTATVNATTIDITTTDFSAIAESVSLISNTAVANVSVLDVNSTTITVDGNTTISGTTSTINANTTVNGSTVNVNANTTITGSNVDIVATTTVTGNTVISGTTLDINANTTIDGSTIDLTGNTTITGTNTDIVGSASVTGTLFDVNANTTVDGTTLVVNANTTITGSAIGVNGDLTVTGTDAAINANTTITGSNVDINGTTTVTGNTTVSGTTLDVNANTTIDGSTLAVNANTTLVGTNTDIVGSASITGTTFDVNANTTVDGESLIVNANTSIIGSTISLNANTSITGNSLDVGANTTFNSANVDINSTTKINGDLTVVGDITATGNVSITSTNTVINSTNTNITGTGANITTNNLNISANTTYTGRATFNGNAKFAGSYANVATTDLVVGANSTFTASTLTANVDTFTIGHNNTDTLNINSTVDFNSDINVDGNQINSADLRIEGDLTVIGETFLSSNNALSINEGAITTLNIIDTLDMNLGATVISDIIPGANITYDLGSTGSRWDNIYAGTFVGNLDWTNVTSKPDPTISVALTGDVVGSGSTTLTNLTNGSISFSTTIQPNSVTLGTDTTGNYVQNLVAGTGVSLLGNSGESATPTISIGQPVATTSDVTFRNVTVSEDIVINGDLIVEGTTTTINTNQVNIGDNIIVLNSDETGSPSQDAGFEVERGTSGNVSFLWDESLSRWTLGTRNLVAGTFIGTLSGNATTASRLQSARTISLGGDLSGSVSFNGSSNVTLNATVKANSVALGTDTTGNYAADVDAGSGINVSGSAGEGTVFTVSHADTSSQSSVNNSNGTVIQDITLDTYGHITSLGSVNLDARFVRNTTNESISGFKTFANTTILQSTTTGQSAAKVIRNFDTADATPALIVATDGEAADIIAEFRANSSGTSVDISDTGNSSDSVFQVLGTGNVNADGTITAAAFSGDINYNDITNPPTIGNASITINAGGALTGGGTFTTNQTGNETITINHQDTSSQSSVNNSNGVIIQDITLDTYGHITGINSVNLDGRYYTEAESDSRFLGISAKAADANLLDGLNSTQFLRSDTSDVMSGTLTVQANINVGQNGGGDSLISFYDDNSDTYRTLRWDDSANDWRVEDNNGSTRVLYHSGNIPNATITIAAGDDLTGGGAFGVNQVSNETITINHGNTSALNGAYGGNNNGVVIEDITVDDNGHVTAVGTRDLDTRFLGISAKAADANLLDGLNSSQFLRADANDTTSGNLTVEGGIFVGKNGGSDSVIQFYDDNSNTYRILRWADTINDWRVEDNTGSNKVLYHGGNLSDQNHIGWGQTWQNVLSSRSGGTSYRNTTGKPIMVSIYDSFGASVEISSVSATGPWVSIGVLGAPGAWANDVSFVVPDDHWYRVNGSLQGNRWAELR